LAPLPGADEEATQMRPMARMTRIGGWLVAAVLMTAAGPAAQAAEVKVLSAGAVRSMVTELAAAFRDETGHTVTITGGTVGELRQRLAAGEQAHVVIMSDTGLDQAIAQGLVVPGSRTDVARTAIGVAVLEGAPRPAIATPEQFKQTLLAAKSIAYVDPARGATSGIHFAGVLDRLGIADAVKGKSVLMPGGYAAEAVAKGQAELAVHQISEILPVKGVVLVGPLPSELQKVTVYSAGLPAKGGEADLGRAFIAFLARPAFKPKLAAAGLDYRD
jgi:molybdate transport system substrate-binding protein